MGVRDKDTVPPIKHAHKKCAFIPKSSVTDMAYRIKKNTSKVSY